MQKNLYKYLLTATLSVAAISAQAQKGDAEPPTGKAYVQNSVPGLRYAPASSAKMSGASKKTFQGSSLRHEIEEGKAGVPVKKGGGATATNTAKRPTEKVTLPSDQPATEKKVQMPEQYIPSQEDPAKTSGEVKQDKPVATPAAK